MVSTNEQNTMKVCQQAKIDIRKHRRDFLDFVANSLDDKNIENSANALLPFDKFVNARLRFVDENSLVKSMGVSLMRMDGEPSTFSLGISIEIQIGAHNQGSNTTIFITAGLTFEQLRDYVRGDCFANHVIECFDEEVSRCLFPQNEI